MSNRLRLAIAVTGALFACASVAVAAPGKGGARGAAPRTTTHGAAATSHPSKTTTTNITTTTHGRSAEHGPTKTTTSSSHGKPSGTTTAHGKSAEHSPKKTTTTTSVEPKATTTTSTTGGTTPTTTGPTVDPKITQKLSRDNGLTRRLQSRLGADVDLNAAAAGFRNLGQFVAAVNNSSSPDQFWKLRAAMTGYNMDGTATGQPTLSLGQAKQKLGIADTSESTPTGGSPTTTTSSTTRTSK